MLDLYDSLEKVSISLLFFVSVLKLFPFTTPEDGRVLPVD